MSLVSTKEDKKTDNMRKAIDNILRIINGDKFKYLVSNYSFTTKDGNIHLGFHDTYYLRREVLKKIIENQNILLNFKIRDVPLTLKNFIVLRSIYYASIDIFENYLLKIGFENRDLTYYSHHTVYKAVTRIIGRESRDLKSFWL